MRLTVRNLKRYDCEGTFGFLAYIEIWLILVISNPTGWFRIIQILNILRGLNRRFDVVTFSVLSIHRAPAPFSL